MLSQVSLLFEVENLAMASPATVSRCGMVYNDYVDLGWKPFVQSWLDKHDKVESTQKEASGSVMGLTETVTVYLQDEAECLKPLFDKYIDSTVSFKNNNCKELIPITELNGVISLCRLYDSLAGHGVRRTPHSKQLLFKNHTPLELWGSVEASVPHGTTKSIINEMIILLLIVLTVLINSSRSNCINS